MKLSGQARLHAGVPEVYAALHDPAILVRTIPGCQRLERVGADSYKATVLAGVASIKGSFDGDVRLSDQQAPHSFILRATGAGAPGTVHAVASVVLAPGEDGVTLLSYDVDATVGGAIGGVGQRVIAAVARRTAAEFIDAVDRALVGLPGVVPPEVPAAEGRSGVARSGERGRPGVAPSGVEAGAEAGVGPPGGAGIGVPGADVAGGGGAGGGGVWTAPAPVVDPARQRMRDVLVGVACGAAVALLGVLIGALVAGW